MSRRDDVGTWMASEWSPSVRRVDRDSLIEAQARPMHWRSPMSLTTKQDQTSISTLMSSAVSDISTLVSDQIELTKTEIRSSAQTAGRAFGLLGAAAFIGLLFVIFLLVTIAYALVGLGLPTWAGFGIVSLVLLILAAVLGLVGYKKMNRVQGPKAAIAEIEATKMAFTSTKGS